MSLIKEKKNGEQYEEKELISRIRQNDHQAFEEIVRLYQKRIFKLAYCFFQDREDAMEIVQETFLKLHRKINQFKGDLHFQSWIYKIASNLCIDHYRRFKKKKIDEREYFDFMRDQHQGPNNPEDLASIETEKKNLKHLIRYLPKRQKMVFVMKHFNHLKFKEISKTLNISIGTVKSMHHRAITHLKKQYDPLRRY